MLYCHEARVVSVVNPLPFQLGSLVHSTPKPLAPSLTSFLTSRPSQKQPGYHLDLLLIGCLIFLHSLLGLPWVVGATILSISHVQSLYLYSAHNAPGERPKFIGVRWDLLF